MKIKYISILALLLLISSGLAVNVDQTELEGHTVRLLNVGSGGSIIVDVDGIIDTIPADSTESINNVEITILEAYYNTLKEERSAKLRVSVGTESTEITLKVVPTQSTQRDEYFFDVGQGMEFYTGESITLVNVGSGGSIIVDVDGNIQTIQPTETKIIGGLAIKIVETYYASIKEERAATLKISKVTTVTAESEIQPIAQELVKSIPYQSNIKLDVKCKIKSGTLPYNTPPYMSADLAYYPSPYIIGDNQPSNLRIVVGDTAPASDTLAAVDISVGLTGKNIITSLVSEITNPEDYNLILIGSSKNNRLIKNYLSGTNLAENWGYSKDEGLIISKPNGDNTALLIVTGVSDVAIRYAAKVLANYKDYNLEGDQCLVSVKGETTQEEYIEPSIPEQQSESPSCIINGICEPEYGEDETNCARDCKNIEIPLQCQGCLKDEACLNFGIRFLDGEVPKYCDIDKQIHQQKSSNEMCQNNFECDSNLCISNACVSQGLWKRMMSWFARTFGFVVKQVNQ